MTNFDEMISKLHSQVSDDGLRTEPKGIITIDNKRQFILPSDFNSTIGYAGDVNSQIITFDFPAVVEGHELSGCNKKIIKWSNLQAETEGRSNLAIIEGAAEGRLYLQWKVEPDVFVKAGTIQIAISFYDTDENGNIAFQWTTASFSGLSVAANNPNVGFFEPAENEVLFISEETRRIVAPQGYNNTVCNYGDVGVSKIYFRTKRVIREIDLLDSNTVVKIRCNLNGDIYVYDTQGENLKVAPYSTEVADVDGLVNIVWYVPAEITDNEQNYAGTFSIEVDFETKGKIWRTSTYSGFIIGSDVFQNAEDYLKNPDRYYVLDGELYHDNVAYTVIGGTYLVKKFTEGRDIPLRDREIVAEYDEDEVYKGLKVGIEIEIDGESKVELQSIMPDAVTTEELNSLEKELSQSIVAENDEWNVFDKDGNTIFKVDKDGVYATSLTLNGESVVNKIDGKAPKNHASTDTTYGVANADNYGHAKASSVTPEKNTTNGSIGTDNGIFARGDHAHPAQTTITGNAGTATKLETARTISLTGDVTGSVSFDGTKNVSITATVADDSHDHVISNIDGLQGALDGKAPAEHSHSYIPTSQKGVANGVATLDSDGKVPSSQLPSDVLEYDKYASFTAEGETGKIYIAKDTNKTYRWDGSKYVEISTSLALGTTSSTAFRGDQGKTAYTHSTITSGNPHGVTYQDLHLTTEKWQFTIEGQTNPVTKNIVLLEG